MTVRIRRARPEDVDFLVELANHEEVEPYLAGGRARDRVAVAAAVERSLREPGDYGRFVIEVAEGAGAGWQLAGSMAFEVTNLPPCMALLPARSMQDYNSLNYMRKHAIWSVRARWLMARLLGTPKPYKDTDAAKVRNRRPRGI